MVERQRSVVFGEAVEQYDAARPDYPAQLITDVLDYAAPGQVLEVGAGTGKATAGFAARGVSLTCVEPDPRMAAVLTAKCPGVRVEIGIFEDYAPDQGFGLLYSAQAWHWVDERRRWDLAHAALAPAGAVAVFWNLYVVADPDLRDALAEVDRRHGVKTSSLHRAAPPAGRAAEHPLADDPRFTDLGQRRYQRAGHYPAARYLDLVRSISAYRMLAPDTREALLAEMAGLLGDGVEMALLTDLTLARRTP